MISAVPAIYAPRPHKVRLSLTARLGCAGIALICGIVLGIGAYLTPSPKGMGTHVALGLPKCEFLYRTGIPCVTCGMTTSFSHFSHGQWVSSFLTQPMGAVLALLTAASFWVSAYMAATGRDGLAVLRLVPARYYVLPFAFLAIAAWGWKIYLHLHGL